ncbi:tetratricopeptide repeat protein [Ectobacillus antri]|jgi:tetratricopeptide (TPR) repeat protein|uniref:Tetratricopeptide repeat protein n=1 Tax=Ectobacillus antri TaxID=2486280 RepID=A0ABT6H7M9_9BACI|nr:tetratricopeptide repeat protein [Ectobacillus antri]MDG4657158.1 tetratricopeptide repeat protein [Ectobacillus antri]MDG5754617.1 tetratricopeptide repeat protein [Ectobacillus antri]
MGKKQQIEEEKGQVITFHQSSQYFYEKGMKAYRRSNLDDAIKYLQRAADMNQDPFVLCQLASALSEAGQYYESNRLFKKVMRLDESMTECYYYLANNFAFLGLFQQAKNYAERYLEAEKDGEFREETFELLDIIAIEDEEEEFAAEDELILMQEQANLLIRGGHLEEAIHTLENVLADYPEFWSAHNNLAIVHFQLGQVEEAMRILNHVLEQNPGNLHALCNSLILLYSIGRREQAERLADQLENVHPILLEQRFKLANTLATVGRFQAAYVMFKSLKKNGYEGDTSFHYWFAYAAHMVGDTTLAQKLWERVVEALPDREGKEPWRPTTFTNGNQAALLGQLLVSFKEATTIEEKMLALYLMNELNIDEKAQVFLDIAEESEQDVICNWALYLYSEVTGEAMPQVAHGFAHCAHIAHLLYHHTEKDDMLIEECLQRWFRIFTSYQENSYGNAVAWSAAIEYIVRGDLKENMTQAEIGHMYNVSVSTVRKYVQAVKKMEANN